VYSDPLIQSVKVHCASLAGNRKRTIETGFKNVLFKSTNVCTVIDFMIDTDNVLGPAIAYPFHIEMVFLRTPKLLLFSENAVGVIRTPAIIRIHVTFRLADE